MSADVTSTRSWIWRRPKATTDQQQRHHQDDEDDEDGDGDSDSSKWLQHKGKRVNSSGVQDGGCGGGESDVDDDVDGCQTNSISRFLVSGVAGSW